MRRRTTAAVLAVLLSGGLAACGDDPAPAPWPGPEPTLRLGTVRADATAPLPLKPRGDADLAPATEWPTGCELFPEADATRIVPQTSHQDVEEVDLQAGVVRTAEPGGQPATVAVPGGICTRRLWFAYGQPGDWPDAWVQVSPMFVGGAGLARVNYARWARQQPCPGVDPAVVTACSYEAGFGEYTAMRNGVVVHFTTRTSGFGVRGRWETQAGEGEEPWKFAWRETVVPRFINAVMARIP